MTLGQWFVLSNNMLLKIFDCSFPVALLQSKRKLARCHSFQGMIPGTSKKWRGFIYKTEARLVPRSVPYIRVVYSSIVHLYKNVDNPWSKTEEECQTIIADPDAKRLQTKSKMLI